ncbi:MAG: twin-arginine translocase TatA/TatE family subunit [Lachnospiraceae bacterium]|nr:twin-arginine translocase TatA/TatE family subunit [Lachnospiraceae bacterium]
MFIAALGRIGVTELLVVLLIVLVIFGPKQLPKLSKSLGQTLKGFKEGMADDPQPTQDGAQAAPVQDAAQPVYAQAAPAQNAAQPVYTQAAPAQNAAQPVYTQTVPVQNVAQAAPVQDVVQPVYTAQAVDNTAAAPVSASADGQTGV